MRGYAENVWYQTASNGIDDMARRAFGKEAHEEAFEESRYCIMRLDVRTYILIVVLSATCSTLNTNIWVEIGIVLALALLELMSVPGSFTPKLILAYGVMLFIQFLLFPVLPETAAMLLSLPVVSIRSFFPTIMGIVLLYKNTRVSQMTATFSKMHVPKGFTITLAVAVRYIPTLKEEWRHIRDAMRMRNVTRGIKNPFRRIGQKAECYMVPLFVSSLKTADELAAAAITRGIDDPAMPTCRNYHAMRFCDYMVMLITLGVTGFCIWENYGG